MFSSFLRLLAGRWCSISHSLTLSLTHSLTHSLLPTHACWSLVLHLTFSRTHLCARSHPLKHSLTYSPRSLAPSRTRALTHSRTHARTPARTPVRPYARTHARTHSLTQSHTHARNLAISLWQVGGLRLGFCPCGSLICVQCQAVQSAEDGSHVCRSVAEAAEVDPETEKLLKKIGKKRV